MPQNSVIFGALFLAFVVYITVKGRLAAYVSLLWPSQGVASSANPTQANPNGIFGPSTGIFTSQGSTAYLNGLPSTDQGLIPGLQADVTGWYPSGLPSVPTLGSLTNTAGGYVSGGAPGL